MRELVERFVGRYELWREEQRAERGGRNRNPLTLFAFVAAALVAFDVYKVFSSHHIEWRAVETNVLFIAFLVLCAWKPQWAWVMFPIWGATMVLESPWVYTLQPLRYPPSVRLFSACFFGAMGAVAIGYGFVIRKRYQSYLDYREEARRTHAGDHPSI
jgi:hypothetical protein